MIQTCDSCRYTFKAAVTDQCPDCGKYSVRPATAAEQEEYWKIQGNRQIIPRIYK